MIRTGRVYSLPQRIIDGLSNYVDERLETGWFLRCALENDLVGTMMHADRTWTIEQLRELADFLSTELPAVAWGSHAQVEAWLAAPREGVTR